MRIRLIGSSVDQNGRQFATSYVIDDRVAVDAGCLGFWGEASDQAAITNLFITHSHADHIATLPIFVENAYEARAECVTVWGNDHVLGCIREDIFNDRIWPDFLRLSTEDRPFLELKELFAEQAVDVEGLRITPVRVEHQVRNFGFVIEDGSSSVIIVSDTAPTERIWEVAAELEDLRAVFLECAFPNHMLELAQTAQHLTPDLFAAEIQKLRAGIPVITVHLKPRFHDQIVAELNAKDLAGVEIGVSGKEYQF